MNHSFGRVGEHDGDRTLMIDPTVQKARNGQPSRANHALIEHTVYKIKKKKKKMLPAKPTKLKEKKHIQLRKA